ncbi:tol protein [Parachaetomium inaequale]|uniref:Tol protein n=1 Tax=Parachaetomium inaequale TaxID=2588326 RepID=A0AAN6SN92_9PEZI|nr:tol protein [Parachaetomium inaequale]
MPYPSNKRRPPQDPTAPRPKRLRQDAPHDDAIITEFQNEQTPTNTSLSDQICLECRKIDFASILGGSKTVSRRKWKWNGREISLRHIGPRRECPVCQFFYRLRRPFDLWGGLPETYNLRVFRAKWALGAKGCNVNDSPALIVAPANGGTGAWTYSGARGGIILACSEAAGGLFARQVQPKVDVLLIAEWLAFCDKHHKSCKQLDPPIPQGFRVIDCSTRTILEWESLVHPKHYATLSYVWGGDQGDPESPHDALPDPVPRTIDDAISLTDRLGYRYLWVDRYCIPRDNAKAKHLQLQSMDVIYQHSALTIIAAAGEDPHHGLPGIGKTPRKPQLSVAIGTRTLAAVPYVKDEILDSKWNSRGWTYQEGLLARRRLVFTDTQVYFQCNAMHCLESIQAPLEPLHTQDNSQMRDGVDMFRVFPHRTVGKEPYMLQTRIREYLERSLTFDDDILNAFRGVLAAYERQFSASTRILAGLRIAVGPAERALAALARGLSWDFVCTSTHSPIQQKMERRPGFPSWTWLGCKVPRYTLFRMPNRPTRTSLLDASVEYTDGLLLPWSANQNLIFSRDRAGCFPAFLRIRGRALDIYVSAKGYLTAPLTAPNTIPTTGRITRQMSARHSWRCSHRWPQIVEYTRKAYGISGPPDAHVPFTLLQLGFSVMLVLYQPEATLHYERVGLIGDTHRHSRFKDMFRGSFSTKEVRIG